jgi:hypothetical protein
VLDEIAALHTEQFAMNCHLDNADLRSMINEAMNSNSDAQRIEVREVVDWRHPPRSGESDE